MKNKLRLGVIAKDRITGFVGTVMAYCENLNGVVELGLKPTVDKDESYREIQWFDIKFLEYVEDGPFAQ